MFAIEFPKRVKSSKPLLIVGKLSVNLVTKHNLETKETIVCYVAEVDGEELFCSGNIEYIFDYIKAQTGIKISLG